MRFAVFAAAMAAAAAKSLQSCLTLRYPVDCSLPGSSIHGIFQARVLEWVAIVFSNTTVQKHQFLGAQLSLWSNSHIHS